MPEQKMIEVSRGDLGVKFHTIDGLDAAYNRPVNQARVKEYGKNVDALGISHVTLVQAAPGSYYIVDGQHRIAAISQYGNNHPVFMPATIYTVKEIGDAGRTVSQFISDLNKGRPFSGADRLAVFAHDSAWPTVFKSFGVEPVHGSKRGELNWSQIVRGYLIAKSCTQLGRITSVSREVGSDRKRESDLVAHTWAKAHLAEIQEAARALAWWQPVAAAAARRGVRSLYTAHGITIALLMFDQNKDRPSSLAGAEGAVTTDVSIDAMRGLTHVRLMMAILRSVNYRRSSNKIYVFGKDGRGE